MTAAFFISCLASLGGLSGAFLLLPFQVTVLGFNGPAVTPTNLVFNITAIPSGVYRFIREKRMVWSLAWTLVIGTLPGTFIGAIIRVKYLPDPRAFKVFVAAALLYIGSRLLRDVFSKTEKARIKSKHAKFEVGDSSFDLKSIGYTFNGEAYSVPTGWILALSFFVGIIGGIYGIGGGAIIAPFLVTVFRLPVHSIPGVSLFSTFVSSAAGTLIFTFIAPHFAVTNASVSPDWLLGFTFGVGGFAGIYVGARLQKHIPPKIIKAVLAACILVVVIRYTIEFLP